MQMPAMPRSDAYVVPSPPEPAVDPVSVRQQLDRILASPLFRNSKRYPSLLRYVVEQALDGHASDIKERTLGIEVFGRTPDYDTNLDPVVRISAAEIRKRIAQYYHDGGHENEIRIDIPLGSYIPEFRPAVAKPAEVVPPEKPQAIAIMPAPVPVAPEPKPVLVVTSPATTNWKKTVLFMAVAILAIGVLFWAKPLSWIKPWVRPTALDRFWAPMIDPGKSVLVCIGRVHDPDGRPHGVALSDATTMARITGILQSKGQPWQIRAEDDATFGDLRQGPAVLIGAFNDSWNLRLANSMRFTFHQQGPVDWIEDQKNPASREWSVTRGPGAPPMTKDFALITRIIDPNTDRILVTVGGLWGYGTLAAGEFLSDPKYMETLDRQAPDGWHKKNLQIVLSTEVIKGNSGPPRVLASYSW
jgi:hypothetical protein